MTDLKTALGECLELMGKATPGPWSATSRGNYGCGEEGDVDDQHGNEITGAELVRPIGLAPTIRGALLNADAAAIAALHNLFHDHGEELLACVRDGERWRQAAIDDPETVARLLMQQEAGR